MHDGDILILRGHEISSLLEGQEFAILQAVRRAYEAHAVGASSLPHSTFLNFPDSSRNRVIALPAYLGEEFAVAGVKWISSFPDNLDKGLARASAVLILNSTETGRPEAILEGSIISAKRTAASAALAAQRLHEGRDASSVSFLGCGLINFEAANFLLSVRPDVESFVLFDTNPARAREFGERCRKAFGKVKIELATEATNALSRSKLIFLATTAITPHISDLSICAPGSTILHVSLRDLTPEAILACDNVVDDVDHVCRAQTSVHLAEQLIGQRDFIRCTLADILRGLAPAREDDEQIAVFSPFGLGVLDLAVGKLVRDLGLERQQGEVVRAFLPDALAAEKV